MTRIIRLVAIAALGSLGATAVAVAGSTPQSVEARIGFAFAVGNTQLPAGSYTVMVDPGAPGMLLVQSTDGRRTARVDTTAETDRGNGPGPNGSELVFDKVDNQYFLHEVWIAGAIRQTAPSLLEAQAERQAAADHLTPEEFRVPLRHRG